MVLDLDELVDYRVERMSDGVRVAFGEAPVMNEPQPVAIAEAAMEPLPAPVFAAECGAVSCAGLARRRNLNVSPITSPPALRPPLHGTHTPVKMSSLRRLQTIRAAGRGVFARVSVARSARRAVYTGEPSTDLKDEASKFLRTFAQVTGRISPSIHRSAEPSTCNSKGSLSGFELSIRQNGLTYVFGERDAVGTVVASPRARANTPAGKEER